MAIKTCTGLFVLLVVLIVACSTNSSPITTKSQNEKPSVSANDSSTVQAEVQNSRVDNNSPKASWCSEATVQDDAETNSVRIVGRGTVLHTIKLFTDKDFNGFAFDGVKKTKDGFELAIEYGSRFFYRKNFVFVCRNNNFYLTEIGVDTFDKHNPKKWSRKVIRVRPKLPLEKFAIYDFMFEMRASGFLSFPRQVLSTQTVNSESWMKMGISPGNSVDNRIESNFKGCSNAKSRLDSTNTRRDKTLSARSPFDHCGRSKLIEFGPIFDRRM